MSEDYFTHTEADAGRYAARFGDYDDDRPSPSDLAEPRIPEPGLWAVVEAGVKQHDVRLRWVRLEGGWLPDDHAEYSRLWDELLEPELIREGI